IDPKTGRVLATIPAPGAGGDSGLAWAEGTLWVGQYRDRKIHQVDPDTAAVLRTIESHLLPCQATEWPDQQYNFETFRYTKKVTTQNCASRKLLNEAHFRIPLIFTTQITNQQTKIRSAGTFGRAYSG